jgi:CBS domain-containing protein
MLPAQLQEDRMKVTDTIGSLLKSKGETRVFTIAPGQSLYEALEEMAEHDIGALLVLAGDKLVGILSERDYARKGALLGRLSRQTRVEEVMTTPVNFVTPQHTVDECMNMMTQYRFRHLPVLENGAVVGIVSIGDLVKWVISGQERTIHELESYITGAYPG